jgi:hypothetical protein
LTVLRGVHDDAVTEDPERSQAEIYRSLSTEAVAARAIDWVAQEHLRAQAEMTRRLIVALEDFRASADRWSRRSAWLAGAVVLLTLVLIVLAAMR